MKGLKKALAAVLTVTAMMAALVVPVAADFDYEPVKGTSTKLTKYLIFDENIQLPDLTFTYKIEAGDKIDAGTDTFEVLEGVGAPTVADVAFTNSSTSYDTVQTADDGKVTLPAGMKYSKADITIDFTGCSFEEPGIYRYVLTEDQCTFSPAVICDTAPKYVDVYVTDDGSDLKIDAYIVHTDIAAPSKNTTGGTTGGALSDKIDSITNTYVTQDLYIGKTVDGNQASRDKYFKFTVELGNLPKGAVLLVDRSHATESLGATVNPATIYSNVTNPDSLTVGDDGKVTAEFYLQNGQYVIIQGLTKDATYKVEEAAEDYVSKASDNTSFTIGSVTFDDKTEDVIADEDVQTGFTNVRQGVVPTGIIMKVAPIAAVGIVVTAGIVILIVRSTKRKAEEEA
ncbi:MAG: hypothetical protein J5778_01670 [Clostridiales bacterium]|nr:hypothetical protein [Clostridiales bacterium]